jgi:hypothetical protein
MTPKDAERLRQQPKRGIHSITAQHWRADSCQASGILSATTELQVLDINKIVFILADMI